MRKKFDEKKRKEKIEIEKKHKAEEAAKKERMDSLKHLNRPDQIVKINFKIYNFFLFSLGLVEAN